MTDLSPRDAECLARTRSAVLNVMVVTGTGIAVSGWLLRWRDRSDLLRAEDTGLRRAFQAALLVLAVASYAAPRLLAGRSALRDPEGRSQRFRRAHVLAAAIGALAVPLGLGYGWITAPRLDVVGPFWVVALALGSLAIPRAHELEGLDGPSSNGAIP
jgi:hypothetical protein